MSARWKEAVALEYGRRPTPVVSARGEQALAERIIEEARRHGIHVAEDPALLARLARRNGRDLDGTPIVKRVQEVDLLHDRGLVELRTRPADGSLGPPWVI